MEDASSQTVAYCLSKSFHLDFEIWKWVASSDFSSFFFFFKFCQLIPLDILVFILANIVSKGNLSSCHGKHP